MTKAKLLGVVFAIGCTPFPPPTQAVDDAIASVRRAQAAEADLVPEAAQQLQTARVEIVKARALIAQGNYKPAYDEALRAHTDAELAIALAHKTRAHKVIGDEQQRSDAQWCAAQATADLAGIARVEQNERGTVITLHDTALFADGRDILLPGASAKLNRVVEVLRAADPGATFVVQGHTDSRGWAQDNRAISINRANAVRDYLVKHGVAADRITAEGHGESHATADNRTPGGRASNRRVEIVVKPGP